MCCGSQSVTPFSVFISAIICGFVVLFPQEISNEIMQDPCWDITAHSRPREGEIWFEPEKMEVDGQTFEGERGHLIVRENRQKPDSNLIELVFVRFKSITDKPGHPTVYLDGGPGSSATGIANFPEYMRAFQKLREAGDVILLDQRGIGRSNQT